MRNFRTIISNQLRMKPTMQFNEPDEVQKQARAVRMRALKIRVSVIALLVMLIAGGGWAVNSFIQQIGAKNVAQVNLKNANQEVARLTQVKKDLEAKLKDAETNATSIGNAKSDLQAKINEQESQLLAFAKQAKACELIRTKLKL